MAPNLRIYALTALAVIASAMIFSCNGEESTVEKQTWELVSEGPVPGPSPDDPAVLIERTETLQVPEMARLFRTIVLNAKGDVVSVSIAVQQPGTF